MSVEIWENTTRLLLVEGADEIQFFIELSKSLFGEIPFQIMEYVGKDKLSDFLLPLPNDPRFNQIKRISIVRDADYGTNAFASVCSALKSVNKEYENKSIFPIPKKVLDVTGTDLKLSVLILPVGKPEGMLESVIIEALGEDIIMPCVHQYFECIEALGISLKPEPLPKAIISVYMAVHYQMQMRTIIEGKNVDIKATKSDKKRQYLSDIYEMSWWNWNHPAFNPIKNFLRQLAE